MGRILTIFYIFHLLFFCSCKSTPVKRQSSPNADFSPTNEPNDPTSEGPSVQQEAPQETPEDTPEANPQDVAGVAVERQAALPHNQAVFNGVPLPQCQFMNADECRVFDDTNKERIRRRLRPLLPMKACADSARDRAQQYHQARARINSSHTTPRGETVTQTAQRHRIAFTALGENLAQGHAVHQVVGAPRGWMSSPGHRQNLLNPNYTHMGIGQSGAYWAQCLVRPIGAERDTAAISSPLRGNR